MQLYKLTANVGPITYYSDEFRVWWDSFRHKLKQTNSRVLNIQPTIAYKYQGDFYGLLDHIGIDKHHHYFVMRHNNLLHSTDYTGEELVVNIPDLLFIDTLKNLFSSRAKYF